MEQSDVPVSQNAFADFFAPFGGAFKRQETRQSAGQYIQGLLTQTKRKNCWQIAEALGAANPNGIQRLLCGSDWGENNICQQLRRMIVDRLFHKSAIAVIAEHGFVKRGNYSAGVSRQSWGASGKMENCQVGVYLSYVTPRGHAFLDRELYLPKEWCDDPVRRSRAKIPESVSYQTKPQLAQQMLGRAFNERLPLQWVVGGNIYGNDPALRSTIASAGWYYILGVSKGTRVQFGDRIFQTVKAIAVNLPAYAWKRFLPQSDQQVAVPYDWFAQRIQSSGDQLGEQWLLIRRSVSDPLDTAFFLSNAPAKTALKRLVEIASAQLIAEHLIQEASCTMGLGEYEVRQWRPWYRHMTLAFLAHSWYTFMRWNEPQTNVSPPDFDLTHPDDLRDYARVRELC